MSLLQDLESFSREKLKSVQTTVTTAEGKKFVERKDDDGNFVAADSGERCLGFCEDYKPDDKIYKVKGKLYISSQTGAENFEELKKHNITHILNVGSGIRNAYPLEFKYNTVEILDLPDTNISGHFVALFDFINFGLKNGAILVHCNAGVSRSATVILGYLMHTERLTLEESMKILKEARPCVKPNEGFLCQLQDYQRQLGL
ncbi:PREDICTED: dual specificity protein phosphatase 19-like [Acropora digitifera]|uniref:dual specificity protein phosphatase 19-like n=1 Tax=Acropora digitifera TaxID=70779 RepID=UPI000779FADB|nr:PREDICTED: dual specificity protein phosphatase 19-like [Acropora digitifera]